MRGKRGTGIFDPNLSINLRQYRKALRMTQKEFGNIFGVSGILVNAWESGARSLPQYLVSWMIERNIIGFKACNTCKGLGFVKLKETDRYEVAA